MTQPRNGSTSITPSGIIQLFRRESPVSVLGPGLRAVIWVQGCPLACRNCIVPESWEPNSDYDISIGDLAAWIISQKDIEGITISGGEPMAQAGALAILVDVIRSDKDLGIMCYTGYGYEWLLKHGSAEQNLLLERIDLLIDGPYQERHHENLLWRGSSNQRLICLTGRYLDEVQERLEASDTGAGLEFFVDESGGLAFAGVPPMPRFREEFAARLLRHGIVLSTDRVLSTERVEPP